MIQEIDDWQIARDVFRILGYGGKLVLGIRIQIQIQIQIQLLILPFSHKGAEWTEIMLAT
jgi:hypothetical protein